MKVAREELLKTLQSVAPGLSPKELVEQSSCFGFRNGRVYSYNDEVACSHPVALEVTGAVPAVQLLALLEKIKDDEVDVARRNGELVVKGVREESGLRMESEVLLPLESLEKCKTWRPLHPTFNDAVEMVQQCCSNDENRFAITCVHLHPKWVEAADDFKISRYRMPTGFEEQALVRQVAVKFVPEMGMTKFGVTQNWVHFRNGGGLTLSCRRYLDEYPDLTPYLKVKGVKATLPKGLAEAVEKAEIFSSTNPDNNLVEVSLSPGKWRLKGVGTMGWYTRRGRAVYNGPPVRFQMPPKLLVDVGNRHREVEVSEERLVARGEKWTFVTCLTKVSEPEQ